MDYKPKKSIPKREDDLYKEIEDFEDFELINNAFYEMAIRTKKFKELEKKYAYCDKLSNQINKLIKCKDPLKDIESGDFTGEDSTPSILRIKTPKENFEEALKKLEADPFTIYNKEIFKSLELDFELFKKEIETISLENMTNEEIIEHNNWMESFLHIIPEIIKKELFIDFINYYYDIEETKPHSGIEYEESSSTSLYIKREFKNEYYIETIVDKDNAKVSRTLYPSTKRKLLTEHVFKFPSNHLIIHKQVIKFLEDFFKTTEVKMKKQLALADAFFCYDYYNYRLEEVQQKNKKIEENNLNNIILQEALKSIDEIDNDMYLTDLQKKKEIAPYIEIKKIEELKPLTNPTLHKTSKHFVFDETRFKKWDINRSTALKYYQWIKPYIDDLEYTNIINSQQQLL